MRLRQPHPRHRPQDHGRRQDVRRASAERESGEIWFTNIFSIHFTSYIWFYSLVLVDKHLATRHGEPWLPDFSISLSFQYHHGDRLQTAPLTITPVTVTHFFGPKRIFLYKKWLGLEWHPAYSDSFNHPRGHTPSRPLKVSHKNGKEQKFYFETSPS